MSIIKDFSAALRLMERWNRARLLIVGEPGAGKTHSARRLFDALDLSGAFVAVDCGALHEGTAESELFGVKRGAYTGANSTRKGAAARAAGGVLFLDEIGELSLDLQKKLLRLIQSGEYAALGGGATEVADCHIVCATNRDLAADVEAGRFRRDLWWRLNGSVWRLPPLEERIDDLDAIAPALYESLRSQMTERAQVEVPATLPPEVVGVLKRAAWPGQVRQVGHVLRDLLTIGDVTTTAVADLVDVPAEAEPEAAPADHAARWRGEAMRLTRDQGWWTSADLAAALGVTPRTVRRWLALAKGIEVEGGNGRGTRYRTRVKKADKSGHGRAKRCNRSAFRESGQKRTSSNVIPLPLLDFADSGEVG